MTEQDIIDALSGGLLYIVAALFVIIVIFKGVRIVPQSEKYVVERFGRLKSVLGPGINFIVPFLDVVRHKVSILERQLPNASQDAITRDNVLVVAIRQWGIFTSIDEGLTWSQPVHIGGYTGEGGGANMLEMADGRILILGSDHGNR